MFLIIAIILMLLILTGRGIGWLVGSVWDLLWILVLLAFAAWIYDIFASRNPRIRP